MSRAISILQTYLKMMSIKLIIVVLFMVIGNVIRRTDGQVDPCASNPCQNSGYCITSFFSTPPTFSCYCQDQWVGTFCSEYIIVGSCRVQLNNHYALANASLGDRRERTYACVGNPESHVHVLGVYEGPVHTRPPTAGDINVLVTGGSRGPLTLLLSSYEPVRWLVTIDQGIIVEKFLLTAYYLDLSSVEVLSPGHTNIIVERREDIPRGYGSDNGGGHTLELLEVMRSMYGDIGSFTGTYNADSWELTVPEYIPSATALCSADRCNGNGICVNDDGLESCNCNTGWLGTYCDLVDLCASNPCQNSGICIMSSSSTSPSFLCSCQGSWGGTFCTELQSVIIPVVASVAALILLILMVVFIICVCKRCKEVNSNGSSDEGNPRTPINTSQPIASHAYVIANGERGQYRTTLSPRNGRNNDRARFQIPVMGDHLGSGSPATVVTPVRRPIDGTPEVHEYEIPNPVDAYADLQEVDRHVSTSAIQSPPPYSAIHHYKTILNTQYLEPVGDR